MADGDRRQTDWVAVEKEYRAGQLSVSEIARRYEISEGAVRKRAKRDGWVRDLTDRVRDTIRARLTEAGLDDGTSDGTRAHRTEDDDEIVERATGRGLEVVTSHRRDLLQLHGLKRVLAGRLAVFLNGGEPDGALFGDKESPADLLEKLSRVTARLIPLERQAHNLDDDGGGSGEGIKFTFKLDKANQED